MGTRSLTVVEDGKGREVLVMYRQYDGYPSGHGEELAAFLKPFTVVNGLGDDRRKVANGMGCLAAQIVAHFKTEPGTFYLYPSGTRDYGEEYVYTVKSDSNGGINLKVQAGSVTYFGMPGTKQEAMPTLYDGPVSGFSAKACGEDEETA